MALHDPLKSAMSLGDVGDTSLALPSANLRRSGEQRVLDQVETIRRTRTRSRTQSRSRTQGKGGSGSLSPTSPLQDNVFVDSFKTPPVMSNGSSFNGNALSKTLGLEKRFRQNTVNNSKGSGVRRATAQSCFGRSFTVGNMVSVGVPNTSCSEPNLDLRFAKPQRTVSSARHVSNSSSGYLMEGAGGKVSTNGQPRSPPHITANGASQTKGNTQLKSSSRQSIVQTASKSKVESGLNGNGGVADISMTEAVEYLSKEDPMLQLYGATFIQHSTFIHDKAKQEVFRLMGIPPLVALLRSPKVQVSQTASAALRNLSFKDDNNKEQVNRCGGVGEAAALLRESDSSETQKQLTGLLWNLSSVDSLKPDLVKGALPVLMERVVLPHTAGPDRGGGTDQDPEVFFHTTGCLRNLSSGQQSIRQTMRQCRGLVDSLVSYVQGSEEAGRPDVKSVENCVCVLHNLTFQLEAEAPALFSKISALSRPSGSTSEGDTGPIGCFSPQSSKVLEQERHFDYPVVEDPHPKGAGWLIHSKTLRSYLSLLGSSQRDDTLEACSGALLNLTAQHGTVSSVMAQTIVQKLNGLQVITPLLKSPKVTLQRNLVSLIGNLARSSNLQSAVARQALPELLGVLSTATGEGDESDDTLAMACQTAHLLLLKEPKMGKYLLTGKVINSLNNLSQNRYFPKSSKAAALLLFNLWSEKDIQSFLKKRGMNKASFVNDVTTTAHKSIQVVE